MQHTLHQYPVPQYYCTREPSRPRISKYHGHAATITVLLLLLLLLLLFAAARAQAQGGGESTARASSSSFFHSVVSVVSGVRRGAGGRAGGRAGAAAAGLGAVLVVPEVAQAAAAQCDGPLRETFHALDRIQREAIDTGWRFVKLEAFNSNGTADSFSAFAQEASQRVRDWMGGACGCEGTDCQGGCCATQQTPESGPWRTNQGNANHPTQ